MRVIAPYDLCKDHATDNITIYITYNDREICLKLINRKLHHIDKEIKRFSLSKDIYNTLFSKEMKYRRYRGLLTQIRNDLEESLFTNENEIIFTYEKFSIFYAAIMSEFQKIMGQVDQWGYDIIDGETALVLNAIMRNEPSFTEEAERIDDLLFPEHNQFIDALEEKYWIIDNDDSFTSVREMQEENKNIGIFIHEYEIEYMIENMEFFRETIEKKPATKSHETLKLFLSKDKYVPIPKEAQLYLIFNIVRILEKWRPGDREIYLSSSEYILLATLIKGFYLRMSEKFQDYSYNITEIEQKFIMTSFIQTRLFLPYVKPIENYTEPVFNRYFYD